MALLDRVTRGRGELAIRYSMVSVFGVVFTQLELAIYVGLLDLNPTRSNVVAVMICAVPGRSSSTSAGCGTSTAG